MSEASPGAPPETREHHPGRTPRILRRAALALAVLAFSLRVCALSAGPGEGPPYHPDVAKQVRAVQQFLNGDYFIVRSERNYNGYPLFNSHLVEYLVRAVNPPLRAALRWVGVAGPAASSGIPDPEVIRWAMTFWNGALSAGAVALATLLGGRFGVAAGLLAGAFAAVSPLDVASAHYASNDTAAAFFALLTVYFAVRIAEDGALRHYLLGALAAAAAFSSKYNGALAGVSLAVAHILRHPGRSLLAAAALRRALAAALALTAGILLTSPALLVNPIRAAASIGDFMAWVADYKLTEEQLRLPFVERFLLSLRGNGMFVVRATGPLALAGAAAALALARPRRELWVVASLPLAHLLVAFSAKPLGHPVHHLPVVVPLLVLGGAGISPLLQRRRGAPVRLAGAALAASAFVWLAGAARDELFFFSHTDTRSSARSWSIESLPPDVGIDARRAFPQPPPPLHPRGAAEFLVPRRQHPLQPGEFRAARFFLEESSLPVFRNQEIEVHLRAGELIAPDYALPLWAPLPSGRPSDLAFVDVPAFYRSPLVRDLGAGEAFDVTVVSPRPLERAWLVLRGGRAPARVVAAVGGRSFLRQLGASELVVVPVQGLRPQRPAYQGNHFYRWTGHARLGSARVALVADEATLGEYCLNAGMFAEAWRHLAAAGVARAPSARGIDQAIAGLASGSLSAAEAEAIVGDVPAAGPWGPGEIRERFGIHPDWLDGLPYVSLAAEDFLPLKVPDERPDGDREEGPPPQRTFAAPEVLLEPGRYVLEMSGVPADAPLSLEVRGAGGRLLLKTEGSPPSAPSTPSGARFALRVPTDAAALVVAVGSPDAAGLPPSLRVRLRPDAVGSVQGRLDLLRLLLGRAASREPDPTDYDGLLAAGDAARGRGSADESSRLYRLALAADPDRPGARERLGLVPPLPAPLPVRARFDNRIELSSFRVDPVGLHAGGALNLSLRWVIPEDLSRLDRLFCWIHVVDGTGKVVFTGDHPLQQDLCATEGGGREDSCWSTAPIPPGIPAGDYGLRAGLWQPQQEVRIRPVAAAVPFDRRGLDLGTVSIAAAGPPR